MSRDPIADVKYLTICIVIAFCIIMFGACQMLGGR